MSRFRFPRVPAVVVLGLMSWTASGAEKQVSPPSGGEQLFNQFCSSCHDHPKDRIPAREVIAKHTPDEVLQALTSIAGSGKDAPQQLAAT